MKIEIEADDDCIDRIVIGALQRSARYAASLPEPGYTEKYVAACELVIEHFGGKPALTGG